MHKGCTHPRKQVLMRDLPMPHIGLKKKHGWAIFPYTSIIWKTTYKNRTFLLEKRLYHHHMRCNAFWRAWVEVCGFQGLMREFAHHIAHNPDFIQRGTDAEQQPDPDCSWYSGVALCNTAALGRRIISDPFTLEIYWPFSTPSYRCFIESVQRSAHLPV